MIQQLSAEGEGTRVDVAQLADEVVDLPGEQVHEGALLGRRTDRVHRVTPASSSVSFSPTATRRPLMTGRSDRQND